MRTAIYARVSTKEQKEEGRGLSFQVKDCQAYARRHNLDVIATIQDDISGATRLEEREGGKELLNLVTSGQLDAVIVWRLDRLSRPPEEEYSRLLTTIEHLARYRASVHDCETGEVKTDMTSIMIAFFKGLAASEERAAFARRSKSGRLDKAQDGKWVGSCPTPYGYRKIGIKPKFRLVIDEEQAAVIRRIFDMFLGRNGEKRLSLGAIARKLTSEGIPTARGKYWYRSSVLNRVLRNRNYLGEFTYSGVTIYLPELAIIDNETWEAAQERIEKNKRLSKRNQKYHYLLSGHLFCACGGRMTGKTMKKRWAYYYCKKRMRDDHATGCQETGVRLDIVDADVWEGIVNYLTDDRQLDDGLDEMMEKAAKELHPTRERLEIVTSLLTKMDGKVKRLMSAFGNEEDDTIAEALQNEIREAAMVKQSLETEKRSLEAAIAMIDITPEIRSKIKEIAGKVRGKLRGKATFEQKRNLLDALDVQVKLTRDETGKRFFNIACAFSPSLVTIEYDTSSILWGEALIP